MEPSLTLTVFVGIIALAVLAQSVALVLVSLRLKRMSARLDVVGKDLLKQVDTLAQKADDMFATVKSVAAGAEVVRDNLMHTTGLIRSRASELDGLLDEITKSARLQVAEVQYFVESSTRKIEETFDLVQKSIIEPIREVGALLVGLKAGLEVLLGKRRRPVDRFQHDEEMFI
jgi:hypothetical protein